MSKALIVRLFVGSLVALAGGLVLLVVAGTLAYTSDSFVMNGPDVVGVTSGPFGWTMIGLAVTALFVMLGAAVTQFVAWIGTVLNTAQLQDKTWCVILIVTGLLSFGFIAMLVYVIAGPDGAPAVESRWISAIGFARFTGKDAVIGGYRRAQRIARRHDRRRRQRGCHRRLRHHVSRTAVTLTAQ